jgi:cytochrome bd ubiquinol oxidase subunit II
MTALEPSSLALFWAGVIAVAIVVYAILDGFDLGVGVLFGTTRQAQLRSQMIAAISPFWDGNETWLVVIGASLYRRFRSPTRCLWRPSICLFCCCCLG